MSVETKIAPEIDTKTAVIEHELLARDALRHAAILKSERMGSIATAESFDTTDIPEPSAEPEVTLPSDPEVNWAEIEENEEAIYEFLDHLPRVHIDSESGIKQRRNQFNVPVVLDGEPRDVLRMFEADVWWLPVTNEQSKFGRARYENTLLPYYQLGEKQEPASKDRKYPVTSMLLAPAFDDPDSPGIIIAEASERRKTKVEDYTIDQLTSPVEHDGAYQSSVDGETPSLEVTGLHDSHETDKARYKGYEGNVSTNGNLDLIRHRTIIPKNKESALASSDALPVNIISDPELTTSMLDSYNTGFYGLRLAMDFQEEEAFDTTLGKISTETDAPVSVKNHPDPHN